MGRAYNAHGGVESFTQKNTKKRALGRPNCRWNDNKVSTSGQMVGYYEHGNEYLNSIREEKFLY